jgi:hypothetical protein
MKNGSDSFTGIKPHMKESITLPNTAAGASGYLIIDTNRSSPDEGGIKTQRE